MIENPKKTSKRKQTAKTYRTEHIFKDTSSNFGKFSEWLGKPKKDENYLKISHGEMVYDGRTVGGAQLDVTIDSPDGVSEWTLYTTGSDGEIYLTGTVNGDKFGSIFDSGNATDLETLQDGFMSWAWAAQTDGTFSIRGSLDRGKRKPGKKK